MKWVYFTCSIWLYEKKDTYFFPALFPVGMQILEENEVEMLANTKGRVSAKLILDALYFDC